MDRFDPSGNTDNPEELQKIAEELEREGRYGEAATLYRELVHRHPGDDSFLLKLAWACHDDGRIDEAVGCFEALFEKELTRKVFTGFGFDELVRIFKREGQNDRLLAVCERAAAAQPSDFALMSDLADAYLRAGRAAEAARVYREMIAMEPDSSVLFCNLGDALSAQDDPVGAEEAYERAATLEPEKAAAYYCRQADGHLRAGRHDRAERAIRKGLAGSDEPAYYFMLGDVLIGKGDPDGGWAAYESGIRPGQASAGPQYFRLGNALAGAACHEKAALAFERAIAADPRTPLYYLRLAESLLALGREAQALEAIKRAEAFA